MNTLKHFMDQQVLDKNGYITLISVITLGAIGLSVVLFLLLAGANSSKSIILLEKSARAKSLVNACSEEALQQIRDLTAFAGSGTLSLGMASCEYLVVSLVGQNRVIYSSSTVGGVIRKARVTIDTINPEINITSWEEMGNF